MITLAVTTERPVDPREALPALTDYFGLIAGAEFDRVELYGFEVDMEGQVLAPEFRPETGK